MSPRVKEILLALIRVGMGVAFVWSASSKFPNMQVFAEETANYRMLPAVLVSFFAVSLAGVELLTGILTTLGVAVRATASVMGLMLVAFIIALSQALLRGIDLRCGCFGGSELASWWTVARDVAMLAACLFLAKAGGGRLFWPKKPGPTAAAPAAGS
ncbi:MAG: MauE/DoxX family redox-associated membrane protein [Myxococcales bacterium]